MHFSDVYVTREACEGKRYNREVLEDLQGRNIARSEMSLDEASEFFAPLDFKAKRRCAAWAGYSLASRRIR